MKIKLGTCELGNIITLERIDTLINMFNWNVQKKPYTQLVSSVTADTHKNRDRERNIERTKKREREHWSPSISFHQHNR